MQNMYTFLQRTRAFTWLMALLVLAATTAQAQVGNYVATRVTRALVPIGGSAPDSTLNSDPSSATDSWISSPIAIQPFNYGGTTYTRMFVTSNGIIQLLNSNTSTASAFTTTPGTLSTIIAPFGSDQVASVATGASPLISMRKFGTDSIIVQWRDYSRYTLTVANADRLTYQAVLVYGSPGIIKFNYQINQYGLLSGSPAIGVSTGSTAGLFTMLQTTFGVNNQETYLNPNLNTSSSGTNSFISSSHAFFYPPASNLGYTFVSAGTLARPGTITTGTITATSVAFSWTNVAAATSGYNWEARTSGLPGSGPTGRVASGTLASGATTVTVSGLQSNQRIVFYLQSVAGANLSGWAPSSAATPTISASATDVTTASIYLSSVASTSASFRWTAATTAPGGYDWAVTASASAAGPFNNQVASGNTGAGVVTANVTGLTAATQYYFWVRSRVDASNVRSWVGPFIFTTRCASPSALPVSENMNTLTATTLAGANLYPACWTALVANNGTTNTATGGTSTTGGVSSGPGFNFPLGLATTAYSGWVFSPEISLTAGQTVNLSYQGRATNVTGTPTTRVWYGNSADPAAMTTAAGTGVALTASFAPYSFSFTAPSTGTYVLGINTTLTATASSASVNYDDLSIVNVVCGGAPVGLSAGSLTNNSAVISFTANASATSGYEYALSTDGGTTYGASVFAGTSASTSLTVSGLAACTGYTMRIRALCSGGAQQSAYSTISFSTTGPVALPFSENFDAMATVGVGVLPSCWTNIIVTGTGLQTTTSSGFAFSGTRRLWSTWSSNGAAVLPVMALTGGVQYEFSFQGRNADAVVGNFVMGKVNTSPVLAGSSRLATYTNTTTPNTVTASFQKFKMLYTPPSSGNYYFIVQDSVPTSAPNGFSMDDFKVRVAPTCIEPATATLTSTGSTTATGSWASATPTPGVGYFYKLVSGSGSYAAGAFSGQEGLTTSLSQSFGALVDGSTYTLWVRSYCGPGTTSADSSDWTSTTFTHVAPLAMSVTKSTASFVSIGEVASGGNGTGNAFTFTTSGLTSTDDNYSDKTNIGFNFVYNGKLKTQFAVTTNGRLRLFGPTSTAQANTAYQNFISTTDTNWVMPFWDDLVVGNNEATLASLQKNMKWYLDASGPNKKLIAEWVDAGKYNAGIKFGKFQFQVVLEENTNKIYMNYGQVQGFEFVTAANLLTSATVGVTGKGISATPTAGQIIVQQIAGQNKWGHQGQSGTVDVGTNNININPNCDTRYTFDPAGVLAAWAPRDTTAPANDDVTAAEPILALGTEPTNLCNYTYTTKYAKKSDLVTYPTLLVDNATNGYADDDVWFTFQAQSSATTIKMVGAGGMRPAFQLYDATLTPVAGGIKVGTTTDYGKVISLALSTLNIGDFYYIRAYHYHGGGQATATATLSGGAITGTTITYGGSDYNFGTFVTGQPYPSVSVYGDGVGAIIDATALTSNAVSGLTIRSGGTGYTTATIRIDRSGFAPSGQFGLYVFSTPVPPANDLLRNATSLTVGSGSCTPVNNQLTYAATGTTRAAGTDCSTTTPDDDVWYKFVPTEPTFTLKATPGSGAATMDVAVQIFNAGAANDTTTMTSVICANGFGNGGAETISGSVTVGNTYYIRVYAPGVGDGGITGRFSLCLFAPTPLKYKFAQSRNTYVPITGGTVFTPASYDSDTVSTTISPGFTFNGTTYTKVWMSTNGFIAFGNNTGLAGGTTAPLSGFISDGIVAAYAGDLASSDIGTAEMRYQYVGNEHIFQWKDFSYWLASDQQLGFQIRLNTTNSAIRIMYDSGAAGTSFATTQVGLRASAPTFPYFVYNRAATDLWVNTTTGANSSATVTNGTGAGLFPGAGMTFDYTNSNIGGYPVFTGLVGAASTVNYPAVNSARVRWMPKLEAANGYYIRWRLRTDPITVATYATPTAVGTSSTDTSYTITGLVSNKAYIFDVAARNGADVSGYGPAGSFTTLPLPDDATVGAFVSPGAVCTGGASPIVASFRNLGTNTIAIGTTIGIAARITDPSNASTTITGSFVTTSAMATNASVNVSTSAYTFASSGTYTVKLWSVYGPDGDATNDTLTTVVTISAGTVVSVPYFRGFNTADPTDFTRSIVSGSTNWTLGNTLTAGSTWTPREGNQMLIFNTTTSGNQADAFSPCFSISNACSFLEFMMTNTGSGVSVNYSEGVFVAVSSDNGATYTNVPVTCQETRTTRANAARYNGQPFGTDYWLHWRADLSAYNGQTIKIRLRASSLGGYAFALDSFAIGQRPANDVGVLAFQSPEPSPSCASKSTPVTVSIKNYGCSPQSNINVNLTVTGPAGAPGLGSFSFVVPGPVVAGGTFTTTVKLQDLTVAGVYNFTASTVLPGDGDPSNDTFGPYSVTVNASNLPPVAAGTATPSSILIGTSSNLTGTAPGVGPVTYTNNTNFTISTNADNRILSPITVSGSGTVAANLTSVQINLTHTYDGDTRIALVAPNGLKIYLSDRTGGTGEDFVNTTFTGTATTAITAGSAPFSGVFRPQYNNWAAWAAAAGNIAGTWNLEVVDSVGGDGGALINWNITFNNGTVTNTWTAFAGNPATIAGFPYSGTSPGSKTFTTAGTYNFLYQSSYQNGCSTKDTVTVLVAAGNVWTGALSNDWGNSGNWQFGSFTNGSAATIPAGTPNSPLITTSVSTTNITLGTGQTISLGAGGSLNVAGNVTGNLSNIGGSRAVTFSGTGVQTINGVVTLDSVTVTNTNATGLTFAAGAQLRIAPGGNLRLGNNARITVPANAALVLKSSATATARLLAVPASAQITGNITMERRTPTLAGWYFVGAPVKTGNLSEWAEMGARVTPKNNSNIFEYTEPDTTRGRYNGYLTEVNGWKVPSALTNPINPTTPSLRPKGYRMYLNNTFFTQQNATLSVTGQPIVGNVAFPFTKTAAGFQGGGWNLASNPYPCEIDWQALKTDAVAGNASAPLSDFIQIWNTALGAYSNYSIAIGLGTNGGSRYIPSSQAFFIRATGAGNLNFRETHKTQQTNTFLRDVFPANTLRLTLSNGTNTDQSVVAFRVFGSNGRDQYDADKLNGNYLNVSTMPEPTLNLVANVMGELVSQTEIPVRVGTTATGTQSMTLSFEGIESFDAGSTLYLRDNYLNTLTDLNQTQVYSFQITNDPATFGDSRFVLVTAPQNVTVVKTKVQPAISVWPNPAEGASKLNVRLSNLGNGNAVVTMTDALGREVARTSAALSEGTLETSFNIESLPAGVYMLRARSGSATIVKEVVVR